ncbi:4356_t:CDS:2 [Dentiscutata heterogama]|uniref:4356_t:CDS:1 n=1 Tax=Dentiscutata heterogama TaxID=1316150 RepID=A0ACA9LUY3_9GLOM|nr:4356_t:CDS:2 [Dentiscutata heterogama]
MSNQQKQHRTAISDDFKHQICEYSEADKNKKQHEIAITEDNITDATQIQQDILSYEEEDTNQIIANNLYSDSYANLLANALNDFFYSLNEDIPTENILNDNDIINLIQAEMCNENDSSNHSDDSEEELEFVLLSDASKSLHMWVTFFEQQQSDEFKKEDIKFLKTILK